MDPEVDEEDIARMGTTTAPARASGRVPWDIPVRLVSRAVLPSGAPAVRTQLVGLGHRLPGMDRLRVTTLGTGGRTLLAAIEPGDGIGPPSESPATLRGLLEELRDGDAVPVVVDASPFGLAVLEALLRVGTGERCTYAELAAAAGRPRAVRAAARVMATNRVALVLPCHRVVPSGGGTGRYRWGDTIKPALLDLEREAGGGPGCRPSAAPRTLTPSSASDRGRARVPGGIA